MGSAFLEVVDVIDAIIDRHPGEAIFVWLRDEPRIGTSTTIVVRSGNGVSRTLRALRTRAMQRSIARHYLGAGYAVSVVDDGDTVVFEPM